MPSGSRGSSRRSAKSTLITGAASDIVPALHFLMSDAANFLHGVNLHVSNGEMF
ncbi:MAG: hypothetical protein QM270_08000 [Bacillota bacterium]|nr:hypothetical protein [Bacillota bacterium]